MSLMNWQIGTVTMAHATAMAPAPALLSPASAPAAEGPAPQLPSGQARSLDTSTPFFIGGVTVKSTTQQADANFTVVDVPVRTIATANNTLGATVELAIAHR